jgi:hypothetical protein
MNAPCDQGFVFSRRGDYWIIQYGDQPVFIKTSRGLECLALLLRHPGREFHVMELVGQVMENPRILRSVRRVAGVWEGGPSDTGPVLDLRAKTEYRQRFEDLRGDLVEAERFNDPARAERVRNEIAAVAGQLASAVGLGGRDRKTGSDAERARSAVTKRIKNSINKINEVVPSLGTHLAIRVKTGYFCSYKPHPERPVPWRF